MKLMTRRHQAAVSYVVCVLVFVAVRRREILISAANKRVAIVAASGYFNHHLNGVFIGLISMCLCRGGV